MTAPPRLLVLGFGNPGRRDDGLGPAAAAALEALRLPGVTVEADYQLSVEDAATVARHDAVLFIDGDRSGPAPFRFEVVEPGAAASFSTHSVRPGGVVRLAQDLFGAAGPAYLLGIRGYEFDEFGEGLSAGAQVNLAAAIAFVEPLLRTSRLCEGPDPEHGLVGETPALPSAALSRGEH
ncbi:MAG: hydrogenase maturation protease [Planctomycetota bacterium]